MSSCFGEHLQTLLSQRSLSGLRFARMVGTASSTVSQISSGKRTPPLANMEAWATALGLQGDARARFIELAHLAHCPERIVDDYLRQQARIEALEQRLAADQALPRRAAEGDAEYRS